MVGLIKRMWHTQPDKRPPFAQIVQELRILQYDVESLSEWLQPQKSLQVIDKGPDDYWIRRSQEAERSVHEFESYFE